MSLKCHHYWDHLCLSCVWLWKPLQIESSKQIIIIFKHYLISFEILFLRCFPYKKNYSHAVGALVAFKRDTRRDIWPTWGVNQTVPGKIPEPQSLAADGLAGARHRLGLSHRALPKQFLESSGGSVDQGPAQVCMWPPSCGRQGV